jgi:putative transposase
MYEYRQLSPEQRKALVKFRQERGYPWHAPPHPLQKEDYYLLTAANFEHSHIMNTEQRRIEFQCLLLDKFSNFGADIVAWVVLPNHYHLLVWLPNPKEVKTVFNQLHGSTSRQWNLKDKTFGRRVWYRYSDRLIRSERHFYATINYIHYNPVKHGFVKRADQWVCSSIWAYFESKGREWLVDIWRQYPIKDYGKKWDL